MKIRSLMTAICVLATANIVSAAPFAYVANSGTKNVSVIDTATDTVTGTMALPDTNPTVPPYAYGVAVGSSGQNVYVGLQDTNEVAVLDAATGQTIKRIGLGSDSPGGLAVNDAETRLYVASNLSNTLIVIDISNIGAAEVGRVTLDEAVISNPLGVALKSTGDKAYVANTSTGNIAVIDIDETNNIYQKSATIALGGVQPMGVVLSADESTLYTSSLSGDLRGIKLSDNTVTELKTDNGTVALAVKPDGSKVYAPSNSTDKLFVVDSSVTPNVVLGTNYPVAAGPYGASITPDGSKLYLTMNTGSAGETVKVFDTTSNSVTATINLPTLAKPTSFGNFIGPVLPFTIAATAGTNCTISPAGTVAVNNKGRTFNVAATSGACEVKVNGVSVGQPSAYSITDVIDNSRTIDASQAVPGTYFTLTVDWNPTNLGSRCLQSSPAGIGCYSKSAKYLAGTQVSINAITGFVASNWTGACAGQGSTCTLTMDADKSAVADLNPSDGGPVYNYTKTSYNETINECIANASSGDVCRVVSAYTPDNILTTGTATIVTVSGGWDSSHEVQSGYSSVGTVTIVGPGIIADKLII